MHPVTLIAEEEKMTWTTFYSAMVGAGAAVMGLLFIAVQLGANRLQKELKDGWQSVAYCTFYLFLTVFFLPLWFLIPTFHENQKATITIIIGVIGIVRIGRSSIPTWKGVLRIGGNRWWQMLWYSVGPITVYLLIVREAVRAHVGMWTASTEENIAVLLLILFSLGLRNSWNLFVEATFKAPDEYIDEKL